MIDYLFPIFILILFTFVVFVDCNAACEYRNYSTGHRYIKAFPAQTGFQRSFTVLQREADIDSWDLGKITYIGYIVAIICSATGVLVIPFSIVMFFYNRDTAMWTYLYWFLGCFGLGTAAFLIQLLDSGLNFLLEIFKR